MNLSGALVQRKGRDAGFFEGVPSNGGGHGFVRSARRPARPRMKHLIGHAVGERRVGPEAVVPEGEVRAEPFEMGEALDERDALQPFVLERLDGALGNGDGAVFADRAEALLDAVVSEKFLERAAGELDALVGDDVLRGAELAECVLHSVGDPPGIGPFQGSHGDDLAGEVVYNRWGHILLSSIPGAMITRWQEGDGVERWRGR